MFPSLRGNIRKFAGMVFVALVPIVCNAETGSLVAKQYFISGQDNGNGFGIHSISTTQQKVATGTTTTSMAGFRDLVTGNMTSGTGVNKAVLELRSLRTSSPSGMNTVYARGAAYSIWSENVTIDAPGLTGQAGTLTGSIQVSGGATHSNLGAIYDSAQAIVSVFREGAFDSLTYETGLYSGVASLSCNASNGYTSLSGQTLFFSIPFQYGTPFSMGVRVAISGQLDHTTNLTTSMGADGTAFIRLDFGNTVTWQGINSILNSANQPVTNATVTSGSGIDLFQAYVDPSAVPFAISEFVPLSGGQFRIRWNSVPGTVYQIETATQFSAPDWTPAGLPVIAGGASAETVVTKPDESPARFWRVVSP